MKISYFFPPWKSSLASKKELYAFGMCRAFTDKVGIRGFFLEKEMVSPKGMWIPLKKGLSSLVAGPRNNHTNFDRNWSNKIFWAFKAFLKLEQNWSHSWVKFLAFNKFTNPRNCNIHLQCIRIKCQEKSPFQHLVDAGGCQTSNRMSITFGQRRQRQFCVAMSAHKSHCSAKKEFLR